jgi:SNF family Na+-dependent transporter
MPIIIGTVVTWIALTTFSLIPKKLTQFEMIFLFCVDTIFELSIFSILHVNLKLIVVEPGVSNGIADLMFRLIGLPLLLVVTSNLLLFSNKKIKWCGVVL